ncbi:hypothetical protein ACJX0J_015700 [Zea mays]
MSSFKNELVVRINSFILESHLQISIFQYFGHLRKSALTTSYETIVKLSLVNSRISRHDVHVSWKVIIRKNRFIIHIVYSILRFPIQNIVYKEVLTLQKKTTTL